ncbi:hypothetical protein AURDEDRAFT_57500 [Auricularia subglabra TFB-10046 SS5]|nr:hypothetical protein AURDEDRAFT_57500 [Auricularia subglabra TFB-10046 SS5]
MAAPPENFTTSALYIASFAQAGAPCLGLLVPSSAATGALLHIRVDCDTSPHWQFHACAQRISGEMALTSLLRLRAAVDVAAIREAVAGVDVPANDTFVECSEWVLRAVALLGQTGSLALKDIDGLVEEWEEFVKGNAKYARRDRFPNVAISTLCE